MLINWIIRFILLLLLTGITTVHADGQDQQDVNNLPLVMQLEINGVIGPATADYFIRSLQKAIDTQANAVLVIMDTPGGLDISMRQIIKKILASPIPVITYVAPAGARAASAGTYILYASHVAAMAPATNLGAATPVQIGGFSGLSDDKGSTDKEKDISKPLPDAMTHKMVNDAAAYIRGLAKFQGRNEQWAEQAVREAASLSAEEALQHKVIDIIASDVADLFRQLQGRLIKISGKKLNLNFENFRIQKIEPDWRSQFLAVITNPSFAYILLMIGIYGLVLEFSSPGSIVPGTVGGICLLLALYALQLLPVNYAGVGLILLGIALMTAESFVPSFGALGMGGVAAFIIGSVILIDTDVPGFGIDLGLVAGFALSSMAFFIIAIGLLLKSRHSPIVSGREEMLGSVGKVLDDFSGTGWVHIHSENWRAFSNLSLQKNEKVRVTAIDGLVLHVIPIKDD